MNTPTKGNVYASHSTRSAVASVPMRQPKLGVKFGRRTASGNEWSTRLEFYQQSGTVPSEQIIGNQAGREQFPDLSAVIVQFGYSFRL